MGGGGAGSGAAALAEPATSPPPATGAAPEASRPEDMRDPERAARSAAGVPDGSGLSGGGSRVGRSSACATDWPAGEAAGGDRKEGGTAGTRSGRLRPPVDGEY